MNRHRFSTPGAPMCCIRCYALLALSLVALVVVFAWAVVT